jgi:hypothetical protein
MKTIVRTTTWWLMWNKVRPCLVRLNRLLFSSKQQRRAKQLSKTTLISLQLFKPTPIYLQLDLWLIWTLSHDLYLFELLTWSYSDSNSTWSPPQPGFQLNQIPHPWTLLGLVLAYPSLDSSLLKLKVLIPLWTQDPSQFGLVSPIFFFNSSEQLTRVTFTLSAYQNIARTA